MVEARSVTVDQAGLALKCPHKLGHRLMTIARVQTRQWVGDAEDIVKVDFAVLVAAFLLCPLLQEQECPLTNSTPYQNTTTKSKRENMSMHVNMIVTRVCVGYKCGRVDEIYTYIRHQYSDTNMYIHANGPEDSQATMRSTLISQLLCFRAERQCPCRCTPRLRVHVA